MPPAVLVASLLLGRREAGVAEGEARSLGDCIERELHAGFAGLQHVIATFVAP